MFRVFSCLTAEHDWRLVVLAGLVCLLASLVAISLFDRARASRDRARRVWLLLAGTATGCGIWATHFIAMLAYEPSVAVSYNVGLTVLSFVVATSVTIAGLFVAVASPARWNPPLGGAIVGGGVAGMHYLGMFALEVPGHIHWSADLVAVSIGLGVVFGALALQIAVSRQSIRRTVGAAILLTLAIVSHHFTAMAAVEITPDPAMAIPAQGLSTGMLALAVAAAAIAVLGISLIAAVADSFLARHIASIRARAPGADCRIQSAVATAEHPARRGPQQHVAGPLHVQCGRGDRRLQPALPGDVPPLAADREAGLQVSRPAPAPQGGRPAGSRSRRILCRHHRAASAGTRPRHR